MVGWRNPTVSEIRKTDPQCALSCVISGYKHVN